MEFVVENNGCCVEKETAVVTSKENRRSPVSSISSVSSRSDTDGKQSGCSKNYVNRSISQIRKHPLRRSGSPVNWFPRKKTESYLKRKIKNLQEVGGMNLSLDETLGAANPHYSRIAREKIAARQAARRTMVAHKAAMVEASWCRILKAARIQNKEAEVELLEAEKCMAKAFETAAAMGVMMYDRPDCAHRPCSVETSSGNGGSTHHTVTASFTTIFEVDKEVAAAVKKAFIRLARCPSSSNKEEFKYLLRTISENPDNREILEELADDESECELDRCDGGSCLTDDATEEARVDLKPEMPKNEQSSATKSKSIKTFTELTDMMFDRLKCLHEDEISSLAMIVATCGLNSALRQSEGSKHDDDCESASERISRALNSTTLSSHGEGSRRYFIRSLTEGPMKTKETTAEVLSLDKYLVKHLTKLEREVLEARNSKRDCSITENDKMTTSKSTATSEHIPGLGEILVKKHVSRLERDIMAAKISEESNQVLMSEGNTKVSDANHLVSEPEHHHNIIQNGEDVEVTEFSSDAQSKQAIDLSTIEQKENITLRENLIQKIDGSTKPDTCDVLLIRRKHMSRIERAKLEAWEAFSVRDFNSNKETQGHIGLDKLLVKPVHRLEKEKVQALEQQKELSAKGSSKREVTVSATSQESLDKVLVKHLCKIEKEKLAALQASSEGTKFVRKRDQEEVVQSLGKLLVKHQSELEKAKLSATHEANDNILQTGNRQKMKEMELNEVWGGMSLEGSIRPHLSRLEREKAAWRKAEEEERRNICRQQQERRAAIPVVITSTCSSSRSSSSAHLQEVSKINPSRIKKVDVVVCSHKPTL